MQLAYYDGFCPFELGDKVVVKGFKKPIYEVYDIIQINSIRDRTSTFQLKLSLQGQVIGLPYPVDMCERIIRK